MLALPSFFVSLPSDNGTAPSFTLPSFFAVTWPCINPRYYGKGRYSLTADAFLAVAECDVKRASPASSRIICAWESQFRFWRCNLSMTYTRLERSSEGARRRIQQLYNRTCLRVVCIEMAFL